MPHDTEQRDALFTLHEWEALRVAVTIVEVPGRPGGRYSTRADAARSIARDWLNRHGWDNPPDTGDSGMPRTTAEVLRTLAGSPETGKDPASIAAGARISRNSIHRVLRNLTGQGLAQVAEHGRSRAPSLYRITPAGAAAIARLPPPGGGGTIPARFRRQLADTPRGATVRRQLPFTDAEWRGLAAAAAAAGTTRPRLLRTIIRQWIPAGAWEKAAAGLGMPAAGISRQTAAILREFLATPGQPRYGLDLVTAAGVRPETVYPALRRMENLGWLRSDRETANPRGRGVPPRTLYMLTELGTAEARRLLGDPPEPPAGTGKRE